MPPTTVLISGASIAGPALAYWLVRAGFAPTLVERSAELREEGQNIDVRGAGREVLRRMGLEDAVRAATTGEVGTQFVDDRGRAVAVFPASRSQTGGATAELEVLRGQLSRILVDAARGSTEHLFGDQIADLDERDDSVDVTFASGAQRRFDLVMLAEGLRSRTRDRVFGAGSVRELGAYCAYLTVPREPGDTDWWRFHSAGRGRSTTLRPDNLGTVRATLFFLSDTPGLEALGPQAQAAVLRRVFDGVTWQAPRVLDALDRAPFYFEALGQARMPSWTRGRVAVTGDAAWCASPISGLSTSLALVGAYVLAGELAADADHRRAFAGYERVMRPFVERGQKLPPGAPRIANPRSRAGVSALRLALGVAASRPVQRLRLGDSLFSPPADAIDLPDYPWRTAAAGSTR